MIAQIVTSIRLCSALLATHGAEVSPDRLCRAAVIVAHVADEWPPELLAGIAYRESRFDPSAVNALTGCWGAMQVSSRRRDCPACGERRRHDVVRIDGAVRWWSCSCGHERALDSVAIAVPAAGGAPC